MESAKLIKNNNKIKITKAIKTMKHNTREYIYKYGENENKKQIMK